MDKVLLFCAVFFQAAIAQEATGPDFSHHEQEIQLKTKHYLQRRAHAGATAIDHGYDALFYRLQLQIFPATQEIEGRLLLEARIEEAARAEISLDFSDGMPILGVGENAHSLSRGGDVVTIILDRVYQPGEKFRVLLHYRGRPQDGGFGAFTFREHQGTPIIASLSEPYYARLWWPCKDAPTDKADSVQVDLTVPAEYTAVSNGVLDSVSSSGALKTFYWKTRYPIATYLVSAAVTNYAEFRDSITFEDGVVMPIVNYVYPENLDAAQIQLADTRDMLAFFSQTFGEYPFAKEKYGHAQFARGGGMEHQTISSVGSFGDGLISHELAHQWWGDMITMKSWQHIWLNEGFATYSEALFVEHRDGREAYREYMNFMNRPFAGSVFVRDTSSVSQVFNLVVYQKGAWVLHMLRHQIGEAAFFQLLRQYAADPRYRFGNAATADFQALAEQISGQDLAWFFEQWVYREGRPALRYAWKYDDLTRQIVLRMLQRQEGESYRLPMELQAIAGTDTLLFTFEHTGGCQDFRFDAGKPVNTVRLDPGDWLYASFENIAFNNFSASCEIVPDQFELHPVYPNPLALRQQSAAIRFSLSHHDVVKLAVYDALGQEVAVLFNGTLLAGSHLFEWEGRTATGEYAAAGVYLVRVQSEHSAAIRKVVLLR